MADLPPVLRRIVDESREAFLSAGGSHVRALVLYGSGARGEWDPQRSDVNLLVALGETDLPVLNRVGGPVRDLFRKHRVRPFLVGEDELPRLADVFPLKLSDIQACHVVVHGDDPLGGIEVDREHLRLRVEQELRNHLLRTRFRLINATGQRRAVARVLVHLGRALRTELWGLLSLRDAAPDPATTPAVYEAASKLLGVSKSTLDDLWALAGGDEARGGDLPADTLRLLERAVDVADEASAP